MLVVGVAGLVLGGSVLAGPDAPTWVVARFSVSTWGLDSDGRTRELLARRYEMAGTVCSNTVYLRSGASRPALPNVSPATCRGTPGLSRPVCFADGRGQQRLTGEASHRTTHQVSVRSL